MDQRVFSDGNVDVILIRKNQLTDPHAPDITELNTLGVNVSYAMAWDGSSYPTNTDSNTVDDRSIKDSGNAQTRGYAQIEASLNFFFPRPITDTASDYGRTYQLLKRAADRLDFYIVTRVLQTTTGQVDPVEEGDFVSVYDMLTDTFVTDTEGEDSYKYTISFLSQGDLAIYTQAVDSTKNAITVTNASGSAAVSTGDHVVLRATLNGKRVTNQVEWASSDSEVASVSLNGVVTAHAEGTADITASHPAGDTSTATVITVGP